MSRWKQQHLKSPWSLTVFFASRPHSANVSHQSRPPIPETQFDLENSRSKVKVKGTPVSAASSWLISLVFHIRASYRLPSLLFHDNRASHSRNTIWPWKLGAYNYQRNRPKLSHCSRIGFQKNTDFGALVSVEMLVAGVRLVAPTERMVRLGIKILSARFESQQTKPSNRGPYLVIKHLAEVTYQIQEGPQNNQ